MKKAFIFILFLDIVIFNIKLICMITMFLNFVNRRPNVSIVFLVVLNIRRAYLLIYLRLLTNMS